MKRKPWLRHSKGEGALSLTTESSDTDSITALAQFNQLMEEVLSGNLQRSSFRTWEIGILIDMISCNLPQFSRPETILREYRNAMQRYLEAGAPIPMKLSEYLQSLGMERKARARARVRRAHAS